MRLSELQVSGIGGGDFETDIYQDLLNTSVYMNCSWDGFRNKLLVNEPNTTMTHDAELNIWTFTPSQIIESINLADPLHITASIEECLVSVDIIDSGTTVIEVSADGSNWELTINNQIHEFIYTGTSLRIRVSSDGTGELRSWGVLYNVDDSVYGSIDGGITDELINPTGLGGPPGVDNPTFRSCEIDELTGVITDTDEGNDFMLNSEPDASPDQMFIAQKLWNAVWNDIADFQPLFEGEHIVHGKCYYDTENGARLCNVYCQKAVIGIASDTFGYGLGIGIPSNTLPVAIAGFVLAYLDDIEGYEYQSGDILTNSHSANLTLMTRDEATHYPERIVATYKRKPKREMFGPEGKEVKVDGRHWVKVK